MKKPEFAKLFMDYMEEISDPENRKLYEQELEQMERERVEEGGGGQVQVIVPDFHFVVKIKAIDSNEKIFVNICTSIKLDKPASTRSARGTNWSLPHSLTILKPCTDKAGKEAKSADFVVHPEAMINAEKIPGFRQMIVDTAVDALGKANPTLKLDRKSITQPKLSYRGGPTPQAQVIRDGVDSLPDPKAKFEKEMHAQHRDAMVQKKEAMEKAEEAANQKPGSKEIVLPSGIIQPCYSILHRGNFDLGDHLQNREDRRQRRPQQLIVTFTLPQLSTIQDLNVDVQERCIELEREGMYACQVKLPYPVIDAASSATWDRSTHKLTVTLPVVAPSLVRSAEDDGGDGDGELAVEEEGEEEEEEEDAAAQAARQEELEALAQAKAERLAREEQEAAEMAEREMRERAEILRMRQQVVKERDVQVAAQKEQTSAAGQDAIANAFWERQKGKVPTAVEGSTELEAATPPLLEDASGEAYATSSAAAENEDEKVEAEAPPIPVRMEEVTEVEVIENKLPSMKTLRASHYRSPEEEASSTHLPSFPFENKLLWQVNF
jgi:dynein assembly factor 2, axonemal